MVYPKTYSITHLTYEKLFDYIQKGNLIIPISYLNEIKNIDGLISYIIKNLDSAEAICYSSFLNATIQTLNIKETLKLGFEGVCSGFIWHLDNISPTNFKHIKDKYGSLLEEYFIFLLKEIFKNKSISTTYKNEGKPDALLQIDNYIIIFEFTTEYYRFTSLYNNENQDFRDDLYKMLFNEGKSDMRGRGKKDKGKFFKLNTYYH